MMMTLVTILLDSGKSGIELTLYILLPVMVVMMAIMKVLEARGVLALVARLLSPALRPLGLPGLGAFALLQALLVSFAAPVATLRIMETDGTPKRRIAATLAMIFAVSQANVLFPMVTVGLNLGITILTSLLGGFLASALTYHCFAASQDHNVDATIRKTEYQEQPGSSGTLSSLLDGGQAGVDIALKSIPILILAIFLINLLRTVGLIKFVESAMSPALDTIGLPGVAALPIATKYVAGGTAMIGITLRLIQEGSMTAQQLNRMAGLVMNPLDVVGAAVLLSAGRRVASVVKPAIMGAVVGLLLRAVLHLAIFSQ